MNKQLETKKIELLLLGQPKVFIHQNEVRFPYKKAEALLYYLVIKKRISKENIGDLFWPNVSEEILVKKNIRNAIYTIRKILGKESIVKIGTDIIELNPNCLHLFDIQLFQNASDEDVISLYRGDFLEGFYIKDNIEFEEWVEFKRQEYRDIFTDRLIKVINAMLEQDEFSNAKKYCKHLIHMDEYDERSYRLLIEVYKREGSYKKCIDVYNKLERILNEEILVSPEIQTTELIDSVKAIRSLEKLRVKQHKEIGTLADGSDSTVNKCKNFFFGRETELMHIQKNINQFKNEQNALSMILTGEEGVGKSKIACEVLSNNDLNSSCHVIFSQCYRVEEKFILKPWNIIFSEISKIIIKENLKIPELLIKNIVNIFPGFCLNQFSNFITYNDEVSLTDYTSVENAIIEILSFISKRKKLIISIDDFQWADEFSVSLLHDILTTDCNRSILFLLTSRNNYKKNNESFILDMVSYELLEKLMIDRFTEEETIEFAEKVISGVNLNNCIRDSIFKETEGNPLFLVELLNNINENQKCLSISPKIQDVLKNRILQVSDSGHKLLDILAIYFDNVDYDTLEDLSHIDGVELVEIIDELIKRNIIVAHGDLQDVYYTFTHQKIREFVYSVMSLSKKRLLHNRAGELIEKNLQGIKKDIIYYPQLIYHFERCGKNFKVFKYKLRYLYECLQFSHEIFPLVDFHKSDIKGHINKNITNEQIEEFINGMEEIVVSLMTNIETDESLELISQYLHMVGRAYIRQGKYEKGLEYIHNLIMINDQKSHLLNKIKGYRQLMCYYINTYQINKMETTVQQVNELVGNIHNREEQAVWWRLEGLVKIMKGDYSQGEILLEKSIHVFESSDEREKYISNLAVAYNWIGESKRYVENYSEAIKFYKKAISLNEERGLNEALSVFYTNAGQAAFDMGDYNLAKVFLTNALKNYEKMDAVWCRSLAHSYYGMYLFKMGDYDLTIHHLEKGLEFGKQLRSPYELGVYYRVMAEIKYKIVEDRIRHVLLDKFFDASIESYCNEAKIYLSEVHSPVDLRIIGGILA